MLETVLLIAAAGWSACALGSVLIAGRQALDIPLLAMLLLLGPLGLLFVAHLKLSR